MKKSKHHWHTKSGPAGVLFLALLIGLCIAVGGILPSSAYATGTLSGCDGCHGYPPVDNNAARDAVNGRFPGAHNTHAGAWYTTTDSRYSMNCEICHVAPIYTLNNHQNDRIQIDLRWFSMAGTVAQVNGSVTGWGSYSKWTSFASSNTIPGGGLGTCSGTYCHSNGTGGTLNPNDTRLIGTSLSPMWNTNSQSIPLCYPCHGKEAGNPQTGAPWYANSPNTVTAGIKANSHQLHAWQTFGSPTGPGSNGGGGTPCWKCHNSTTNTGNTITSVGNHIKRSYTLTPVGGIAGWGTIAFNYVYATNGGTCTASTCHSSGGGNPGLSLRWGSTKSNDHQCVKCHGIQGKTIAQVNGDTNMMAPGYINAGTGVNTWGTMGALTNQVSDAPRVWAHNSHLNSPGVKGYTTVRGVECSDCHDVNGITGNIWTSNHMNGVTDFKWSSLARNVGFSGKWGTVPLSPWYSSGNQSCGNIYCHGGSLAWTSTNGVWTSVGGVAGNGWASLRFSNNRWLTASSAKDPASCNQCHLSPPNLTRTDHSSYAPSGLASDCSGCHGHNGNGGSHIDGILYGAGACNSCHWYDIADAGAWTTTVGVSGSVNLWQSTNAWGAHVKHITHLKTRYGVWLTASTNAFSTVGTNNAAAFAQVCGVCHTQNSGNHMNTSRQIFGDTWNTIHLFGTGPMKWDSLGANRVCSNVDCHYKQTPIW